MSPNTFYCTLFVLVHHTWLIHGGLYGICEAGESSGSNTFTCAQDYPSGLPSGQPVGLPSVCAMSISKLNGQARAASAQDAVLLVQVIVTWDTVPVVMHVACVRCRLSVLLRSSLSVRC